MPLRRHCWPIAMLAACKVVSPETPDGEIRDTVLPDTPSGEYAVTQYTTLTYPGYDGNVGTYSCPAANASDYQPQSINLYVPQLPAGGTVPLLVFFPGTGDDLQLSQLTGDLPDAVIRRAAELGFAAAAVSYRSLDFNLFFPDRMDAKERCVWAAGSTSLVGQLCGNAGPLATSTTQIDCGRGIVVAGHSQGGIMALLAANYEPRVAAAYTLGTGVTYDPSAACTNDLECNASNALFPYLADPAVVVAKQGALGTFMMGSSPSRVLASRDTLAVAGDVDPYFHGLLDGGEVTLAEIASRLEGVDDLACAATSPASCPGPDGSGWYIVGGAQLAPCTAGTACTAVAPASHAGHCFMSTGDSVGCVNSAGLTEVWDPDPAYFGHDRTEGWTLEVALHWLRSRLP